MKAGKVKMKQIMARETGISIRELTSSSQYEVLGSKERLRIGSHLLTHWNGKFTLTEPNYGSFEDDNVGYITREVKGE